MSVQMELESLYCCTKVEINAYTANRVTGNMRVIDWIPLAKKRKHLRHTIPQHWTKTSCGYLDWNRLRSVTLFLEEIKRDPRGPITR